MTMYSAATASPGLLYWGMSGWEVIVTVRTNATSFTSFVEKTGRPLRQALIAAYGPNVGPDVTAEAFAYAWENWDRLKAMQNPAGYLYRVGQSQRGPAARQRRFGISETRGRNQPALATPVRVWPIRPLEPVRPSLLRSISDSLHRDRVHRMGPMRSRQVRSGQERSWG